MPIKLLFFPRRRNRSKIKIRRQWAGQRAVWLLRVLKTGARLRAHEVVVPGLIWITSPTTWPSMQFPAPSWNSTRHVSKHWQKRTRCSRHFTKFGGAILQLGRRQPLRIRWQRSKPRTREFGLRALASRHLNGAPKAYEQLSIVAYVALPVEPGVPATARSRLQN